MDYITRNKNLIGTIEVPIHRENPDEEPVKFPHIAIYFYRRGYSLQREKMQQRGTKGFR
jgi:hypothetical protein